MPVAERSVHVREKGHPMYREKRKISRLMVLLTGGVILMLISDATFVMFNCMQDCPVRECSITSDLDEEGISALVDAYHQLEKYCAMEPPLEMFEDFGYYAGETLEEEISRIIEKYSNFTAQGTLYDVAWDERLHEVDLTGKQSESEDFGEITNHIFYDFEFFKDESTAKMNAFSYHYNPLLDAILLISLF